MCGCKPFTQASSFVVQMLTFQLQETFYSSVNVCCGIFAYNGAFF